MLLCKILIMFVMLARLSLTNKIFTYLLTYELAVNYSRYKKSELTTNSLAYLSLANDQCFTLINKETHDMNY